MATTRRMRWQTAVPLLLGVVLFAAGCSGTDSGAGGATLSTVPPPTPLPPVSATTTDAPFPAPTTVVPSPTTSPPTQNEPTLRADGLGVASFGDSMEGAIRVLTGLIGAPEDDQVFSGPWSDGNSCAAATGYGCDDYLRIVEWRDPVLTAVFLDTTGDPVPRFAGWVYGGGIDLATPDGLTAAMTIDEVRLAVGDRLQEPSHPDRCTGHWEAWTDVGIGLRLTGDPQADTTRVSLLFAGEAFSAC